MSPQNSCYAFHDRDHQQLVIGNALVERMFCYDPQAHKFYTALLTDKTTGHNWAVTEQREFDITVKSESKTIRLGNACDQDQGELIFEGCDITEVEDGGQQLAITLRSSRRPIRIRLYQQVFPESRWLRRWMQLENNTNAPLVITHYNPEYMATLSGTKGFYFNSWRWGSKAYVANNHAGSGMGLHSFHTRNRLFKPTTIPTDSPLVITDGDEQQYLWFFPEVPIASVILREDPQPLLYTDNTWGETIAPGQAAEMNAGVVIGLGPGNHRDGFKNFKSYLIHHVVKSNTVIDNAPLVFNSWYGLGYTDKEPCEASCKQQIDLCCELDVDMYVLDAGWHDHVGDWGADPKKFPNGLEAVSKYCHKKGLKFGLWIDSRIACSCSKLFQDHPEWTVRKQDGDSYRDNFIGHDITAMCMASDYGNYLIQKYVQLVSDLELDCLKIDNVCLLDYYSFWSECYDTHHNHIPGASHKAVWEKWIDILKAVKQARPGILIESIPSGLNLLDTHDMVWSADYQYRPDWLAEAYFYRALLYQMAYTHPAHAIHQGWPSFDCHDMHTLDYLCASTIGSAIRCGITGQIESATDIQKALLKKWIQWRKDNLKFLSVYQPLFEDRPPLPVETVEDDIFLKHITQQWRPAVIDGFAHLQYDGGWIFLFNPADTSQSVRFTLNLKDYNIDTFSAITQMDAFDYDNKTNTLTLRQTLSPGNYSQSRIYTGGPLRIVSAESRIDDFNWDDTLKTLTLKFINPSQNARLTLSTGPLGRPAHTVNCRLTHFDDVLNIATLSLSLPAAMDQGQTPSVTLQW